MPEMRRASPKGLLSALAIAAAMAAWAPDARPQSLVDGYAAVVNGRVITIGDVMAYVQSSRAQLAQTASGGDLAGKLSEAYRAGLEKLIENALIVVEFEKQGLTMPDRLVNDRINEIVFQSFNNDRAAFLAELAAQRVTLEEWRKQIRERLIVNAMRRQVVGDAVRLSPRAVQEYYASHVDRYSQPAQVKLRMIQLNKGANAEEQEVKRQRAVLLRGKALGGEDFGDLAAAYSEGSLASKGGDWGWRDPGILRKELAPIAAALAPGQVSDVIETDDGFYLLYVEDRKPASTTPLSAVRAEIEDVLRQSEGERVYAEWIARLRQKNAVMIVQDTLSADL
jgi:peptidyl-prolyl cis-trans isomerase SurA